jgi:hypothetical protein
MMIRSVTAPRVVDPGTLFYYRCRRRNRDGASGCSHRKCHRAEAVEAQVWEFVSGLLKDPGKLKAGIEAMVEAERTGMRGDPEQETKAWLEKLSEVADERRGYLRLAAKGHITDEELGEALAELEATRQAADKELKAVSSRQEILQQLELDKDALMHSYAAMTPDALDALDPEERHHIYKLLKLKVLVSADGSLQISGALADCFAPENQDGCLCRGRG